MIITCGNVRGLNDPLKQVEIQKITNKHKHAVFALCETRVKAHNSSKIAKKLFPHYSFFANYASHYNWRIWVF